MSDLWSWAVAAYARPGVADACLALQDDHGVNVCYLLWAAWGEAEGRPLDLAAGAALSGRWETAVGAPLRRVRRTLKPAWEQVSDDAREGLRGEVKRLELSAERLLLESLAALPAFGSAPASLAAAGALWPHPPQARSLHRLHAAVTNPGYADGSERRV